ncbi:YfjP family GTPase [Brevibacterium sp. p3-SID960]|uniref:YfjP family GTPase n=1 Tax=Brevibacterium sp. p3-SID960 TaxID=2916063 RepID=UPI0021A756C4|nr:YfjP family GTPase [Brevibacterium sp. p3-SID960]MCT1691695.1 YfjP family GTPase [Brevibacterium sp. p3-SID960]
MSDATRSEIATLTEGINRALTLGPRKISDETRTAAAELLDKAEARLKLGEESTVVAFAGSTGSGKSSLFNAVAGLEIAEVGVRRPTTSKPTACVWGDGGEEIMSWLKVPVTNRTWRESALDGDDEESLHGLVLLDLPDHDSTSAEHRVESDRLVNLVDVVFWVVDPQKYADFSLHSHYLSELASHASSMVVVLNQVDTLTAEERVACREHLQQLLAHDGLDNARVALASALTREGVPELRQILTETVLAQAAASERLLTDLREMAGRIRGELGTPVDQPEQLQGADRLIDAMVDAAGVHAVAQTVEDDYLRRAYKKTGYPPLAMAQRGQADPLGARHGGDREDLIRAAVPETTRTQSARVNLAAHELVVDAVSTLPMAWQADVAKAEKQSTAELTHTLDEAVTAVRIERRKPGWWTLAGVLQNLFFLATVIGALWLVIQLVLLLTGVDVTAGSTLLWIIPGALLLIGITGSVITSIVAASARRRGAKDAADDVAERLTQAVHSAAASSYLAPITGVLREHREVYDCLR